MQASARIATNQSPATMSSTHPSLLPSSPEELVALEQLAILKAPIDRIRFKSEHARVIQEMRNELAASKRSKRSLSIQQQQQLPPPPIISGSTLNVEECREYIAQVLATQRH
ncbi:hypothetical protein BCR33DRAFT_720419 [Rhizoclosmatium globosum]|uniref:Uncharacterized protein n=1 Tax=Rhizoclosmatium globosum TaxID=329046 RepID=A0A1Y2BWZ1_9FUNG|nr:hypothetical protein BCR33DRAFT_720419 [Rhizoclosmatium globosum]|eukprot:ORY39184.1 hypothetical protein BCR33DRAFT_720419 [Rhizoclosmatium globosum]